MKVGDLVKMKYEMWWKVRNRRKDYTAFYGIVSNKSGRGIAVHMPDNSTMLGLAEEWEVVSESR